MSIQIFTLWVAGGWLLPSSNVAKSIDDDEKEEEGGQRRTLKL